MWGRGKPSDRGRPTVSTARASGARRSRARSTAVSEAALLCPSPLRRPVAPTVPAYSVPADPLASGHPWGCSAYRGLRLRPGMAPGCPDPTVGTTGTVSCLSFRVSSALTVPALATTLMVGTTAYPARRWTGPIVVPRLKQACLAKPISVPGNRPMSPSPAALPRLPGAPAH